MVHKEGQFQIFSSECLRQSGNISECEMRVLFEINIFLSLFNIVYTLFSERDKLDIAYLISIQNGDGRNWWTENSIRFLGLLGHWKKKYRIRSINLVVYIVLKKSKQEIIKIVLVRFYRHWWLHMYWLECFALCIHTCNLSPLQLSLLKKSIYKKLTWPSFNVS